MTVNYEVQDGVAHLTLNRPEAGNAISLELATDLARATTRCSEDSGVRVVLLTGAGNNFCVGGDLRSFAGRDDLPAHLKEVTTHLHAALLRLAELDAPVIVAVQGSAAGAGMSLACAGDIVVAASSAKFVLAYTKIGLSLDGGGSWYLPRLVGLRRALDLALRNAPLSAEDALATGIVSEIAADADVSERAAAIAGELATGPTKAFGEVRRLLRDSLDATLAEQLDAETRAIARCAGTPDGHEGMKAFLEKRPPRFVG